MFIFRLAFRNIFRNKRRSVLAITSVTIAVAFVVFLSGMLTGIVNSVVNNYTKTDCGHVRITSEKFEQEEKFKPINHPVKDMSILINIIKKDSLLKDEVSIFAPRINIGVILSKEGKTKTAMAVAGDIKIEEDLMMFQKKIIEGRYLKPKSSREIIIGSGLAEVLKYKIGDKVKVMTTAKDYSMRMRKFNVVGIYKTGSSMLDDKVFQISMNDARKLLRYNDDETQQLLLMLNNHENSEKVALRINQIIKKSHPGVVAKSWTKIGEFYNLISMEKNAYNLIYFIIASLGAIIIGNIMTMVVLERSHEIGILKSLGMSKGKIRAMFFVEGLLLGTVGTLSGLIPGLVSIAYFSKHGLDFTSMIENINIPIDNVITFEFDFKIIVIICIMSLFVSAFLSIIPANRAAKMSVVSALKSI